MQKVDKMYVAFTGQSLEKVQQYTERDRFLSVSEVMLLNSSFNFEACQLVMIYIVDLGGKERVGAKRN